MKYFLLFSLLFFCSVSSLKAQDYSEIIQKFLNENCSSQNLKKETIQNWNITQQFYSKKSQTTYVYIQQKIEEIPLVNGTATFAIKEGQVQSMGSRLVGNFETKKAGQVIEITAPLAIEKAAKELGLFYTKKSTLIQTNNPNDFIFEKVNLSLNNIPVQLCYFWKNEQLYLAWDLSIYTLDAQHWWSVKIDAQSGALLDKKDWVNHCYTHQDCQQIKTKYPYLNYHKNQTNQPDQYKVFALPIESPNHGSRTLVTNPANAIASPFAWHDTDGIQGAEYTITRGNNVYAYEDTLGTNLVGGSPNGGAILEFDFLYNNSNSPTSNQAAAVTNLFYTSNVLHDILYQYGFDEMAGNFQVNNYGKGGQGGDEVLAEAQDGSMTNSASFASPPEGIRPRMEMFVWNNGSTTTYQEGCFDNGVIAHEYAHGLSKRLVGGAMNANCLQNLEQMGEGISDWLGLILTMKTSDQGTDRRGIGTYLLGQPTTGNGLRPAPYSTDFAINNYTYGAISNTVQITVPHGVGFVYGTVLWDLTWDLINQYGGVPDSNLYTGVGGNNIALNLVIESLKIMPCSPGMLDGRDAILQADQLLYNGIHRCLIWKAFAKRGFGFSAIQGSPFSRLDQVEAFNLPTICQVATQAPVADFHASAFNSCQTTISFRDVSTAIPQQWFWDFGDGSTDTITRPTHVYTTSGVYDVQLIVSNSIGKDTIVRTITITLPPKPTAADRMVCKGDTALLVANSTGQTEWLDSNQNSIHIGDSLVLPAVNFEQQFYARNSVASSPLKVPPSTNTFGGGGYHLTSYHGALNFTAQKAFVIKSAWVDAQGAGPRTFYLGAGANTNGQIPSNIIDQVTVNLVNGPQRVILDLEVPMAGDYNIGGSNVKLYRNNSGTNYPYVLPNFMTINNSSAPTNPTDYYYYFYDIEVQDFPCISALDTVTVLPIESKFSYTKNMNTVQFADSSVGATTWLWYFGDGDSSTLENPIHTYANLGTYTVTLVVNGKMCSSNQVINLNTSVATLNNNGFDINLSPNPTTGKVFLELEKPTLENLDIQIIDGQGRVVKQAIWPQNTNEFVLDFSPYPTAVYIVKIKDSKRIYIQKVIKG